MAGLLIVMILMSLSQSLQIPELDGLASVIVGVLLVFVSFILARESRSLLSTYQPPEDVILMLIIDFKDDLDTEDITEAITRIRTRIKTEFQFIHYVIIQPE